MDVTLPGLRSLNTTVSTAFNIAYEAAAPVYNRFTMVVPSTGAETNYPRLDQLPGMREWVGDRIIHALAASGYVVRNKTFESTISISREQLEDDQFGIFMPAVSELGGRAAELPDQLIANLMNAGDSTLCFDGQYMFGAGHVNYQPGPPGGSAVVTTYSNYQAGAGPAWYLVDNSHALKPFVYQNRRDFRLIALTQLNDFTVFTENRFIWGVDGRSNAGYGLWQLAYKSKAPLTAANYAAARAAMATIARPDGAPMGITPNQLITGPSLEGTARKLLLGDYDIDSTSVIASNPWKGSAEYIKSPWIA